MPSVQTELFNITNYHTEQNQRFKFDQLQAQIPDLMDETAKLLARGKDEQAGLITTEFLDDLYKGGVTGEDANKTYTMIVKAAFDKSRLLVDPNKPLNLAVAANFADRILQSIPYGNKDLTSHPSYLDESADFYESYDKIFLSKLQTKPKIEIELKKAKVKQAWQSINNMRPEKDIMTMTDQEIEEYNLRRQQRYNEILNNPEFSSKEVQNYAQSLGKSDNLQLINIDIPELKNKITKGAFDGYDDILEQEIAVLENNHATMDREAIGEFEKLKTFAATSKGLAEDIDGSLRNIMTEIDRNLGTKGGFLTESVPKDFAKSTQIRFEMQTKLTEYYQNFIETKKRRPSSLERQNIERQYFLQIAAREEVGEITDEFANKIFPPAVLDEEGNIKSGFENPFVEKQPLTSGIKKIDPRQFDNRRNTNEFMEQGMFDPGVASEISDEEAERIITAEDANDYLVQAGDTLSAIAENFGITVRDIMDANNITDADLINIGQQLTIPEPEPLFIDQYKGKAIPDFGGLGKLVISGESAGHGIYNAFNKGTTASAGTMDITSKTIAEMEQMQSEGKVFAVGAYQLTPGVLTEAREVAGIDSDAIMTPAVQDRLFWGMLTGGQKRPELTAYLLGESDDLNAAHEALALEFAVIQGPDGKGRYDKDKSGNVARIKAALVKQALIKARKEISNK